MIENKIIIYIRANSAEPGPPLGTILGNLGINTVKFCKDFNEFTKELPIYLKLSVKIVISSNKTYLFSIKLPSTGSIISLLRRIENTVDINELCMLALMKFPQYPLNESLLIILGSLRSSGAKLLY